VLYLPYCTSHGRERGKKRRRGREVPSSSLLLQRKKDHHCAGIVSVGV
jgi:hypothetical protein